MENKTKIVHIRLDEKELEQLKSLVKNSKHNSISSFVREKIFEESSHRSLKKATNEYVTKVTEILPSITKTIEIIKTHYDTIYRAKNLSMIKELNLQISRLGVLSQIIIEAREEFFDLIGKPQYKKVKNHDC